MGEVIDLLAYRLKAKENPGNHFCIEVMPPTFLIKYFENGVVKEQYRVISERMLRDLLDEMV